MNLKIFTKNMDTEKIEEIQRDRREENLNYATWGLGAILALFVFVVSLLL